MEKYCTLLVIVVFTMSCESALTTFGARPKEGPIATTTEEPLEPLTKVYHVYKEFTANWHRAYHYCAQKNMQLATIDSQNEYNQLRRQIVETKYTENFWIGLTKLGNPKFYWYGYNKPVTFNSLDYSAGPDRSCASVSIDSEYWSTNSCNDLGYFVCESSLTG